MTKKSISSRKVYFGGELFSLKHLIGNAFLGQAIEKVSKGRYSIVLPQDLEVGKEARSKEIRDGDLASLLSCDLGIFNFDGQELDSGTLVEFLFAKFADIPSLLIRSDFRKSGDNDDVPWNLMAHHYPRTETLLLHSMRQYGVALRSPQAAFEAADAVVRVFAKNIVGKLDSLATTSPLASDRDLGFLKEWIIRCADIVGVQAESVRRSVKSRIRKQ